MNDILNIYAPHSETKSETSDSQKDALDTIVRAKLGLGSSGSDAVTIDDRNDPPSIDMFPTAHQIDEVLQAEVQLIKELESTGRPLNSMTAFPNGRDYLPARVRIVNSTYKDASNDETAVLIQQGRNSVTLSLETLAMIVDWAKG